jgi:hypothetical protein
MHFKAPGNFNRANPLHLTPSLSALLSGPVNIALGVKIGTQVPNTDPGAI